MKVAKGSLSYLHAIINKVSVFVSSRKRQVSHGAEYYEENPLAIGLLP